MHPTRKAKGITKVERQTVLEKMDEIVSGAQKELEEVHKERKKIEEEYNDYERAATQFLNVLRRTRTTIEKSPYVRRQSVDRLIKIRSAQSDLITKTCGSKRLPRAFNLESGRALRLLSEIRTL
uniref:Tubulin-specific chaperone A n=1 Tax=Steinernema glaseri TaxID=37863 RepID=A0A1I7YCD1_9BILA